MARSRVTKYAIFADSKSKAIVTEDLPGLFGEDSNTMVCLLFDTQPQADEALLKLQGPKYDGGSCVVREVSISIGPILSQVKLQVVSVPPKPRRKASDLKPASTA